MPTSPSWTLLDLTNCELGESPFWHPQEQRLYWVDIPGKQILRTNSGGVERWDVPSEPGCIAPALGGGWVMALRHGVFRARQWGGALERVATLPYDTTAVRANDGKCDALGRFWVGTIDETKKAQSAALFSIDARHSAPVVVKTMAEQALTANGLAWSLSGDTLYWADTPKHLVHAWSFDVQSNAMSGHRTHLQFDPKPADWRFTDSSYKGRPDGAAVDAQGNYWVAMFEGARVCQFAPDGTLMAEIKTPAQCPTMPCFGGADLKTLFITTARHGRSDAELTHFPNSGCVFSLPVEVPGLAVNFFDDGA